MSLSWTYITRRFILQNYRDAIAVGIIGSFFSAKFLNYVSQSGDNEFMRCRLYTNDETDIEYREAHNKTDAAVRREKVMRFAKEIKAARAEKEREQQLDAYNFLNGKNHTI
jgi:hypothetical protein